MTRFLLIRHAATDSVGKFLSGRQGGISLNHEGYRQAQQLAENLKDVSAAAIFSSPMERALQTAAPLQTLWKVPVLPMHDFNEIDFGDWTGASIDSLNADEAFRLFNTFRSIRRIPGGESMAEAQLRIVNGMGNLARTYEGQTVAIISHADMIRAALLFYLGMPLDLFSRLEISVCSTSIVEVFAETSRVTLINYTGDIKM